MAQATTLPTRFADQPNTLLGAHAHLIERLNVNKPHHLGPRYLVDAEDLNERSEHLQGLMIAVTDYVRLAVKDVDECSNQIDGRYIIGCLDDLTGEITGALRIAAEDLQAAA